MKRIVASVLVLIMVLSLAAASAGSWKQDSKGWWYRESNGSYPANTWKKIKKAWYYFDASGYMVTGWLNQGGKTYHLASSGKMDTGWKEIGGAWYYFNGSGEMARNTTIDGRQLGSDGKMIQGSNSPSATNVEPVAPQNLPSVNGFVQINGEWYYYVNGIVLTGWQRLNGKTYYFYSSGAMAHDAWVGDSYFGSDGTLTSTRQKTTQYLGWTQISGNWYYYYSNGGMAVNTWIDGEYFGADGRWIPNYSNYYSYNYTSRSSGSTVVDYICYPVQGLFHRSRSCINLAAAPESALIYVSSRDDAYSYHCTPCPDCKP